MSNVKMIEPLYQTDDFMLWEHEAAEDGVKYLVFEFADDDVSHSFTIPISDLTIAAFKQAIDNLHKWVGEDFDEPFDEDAFLDYIGE